MGGEGEDLSTAMTIGDLFFSSKFLLQRVKKDDKMKKKKDEKKNEKRWKDDLQRGLQDDNF